MMGMIYGGDFALPLTPSLREGELFQCMPRG
jgi:hypothetical protein